LAAARSIQMGMLPRDFTPSAGYDLYAVLEPAKAVGGDLFDFFMLDDHRLFFLIGDVSDKGVPAALFMAVTKTLFTAEAQRDSTSVSRIMERVNQALCQNNPEGMFVTVFIGILDVRTGAILCSDGGHDAPLALRTGGVEVVKKQGGMALGIFADVLYREWTIQLAPGEGLAIYTDGVSEAMNADGQMFGSQRLLDVLNGLGPECPAPHAVTDGVMSAVRAFVGDHLQSDDITLLALRWQGSSFGPAGE
jgi:sigma-B regulation protein RsbU (phosphoserine phosphatase)